MKTKITLLAAVLATALFGMGCASSFLDKGLVAYYPFNGNAKDESSNENHGEAKGPTLVADRHGQAVSAYSFDGTDDYIEINDAPELNFNGRLTLSFWIKPDVFGSKSMDDTRGVISKKSGYDGQKGYVVYHDFNHLGKMNFRFCGDGPQEDYLPSTSDVTVGQWEHWLVTYENTTVTWFRNGTLDKTYTERVDAGDMENADKLNVGRSQTRNWVRLGYSCYFDGSIDDVRIYNRALSAEEITALYELEKPKP